MRPLLLTVIAVAALGAAPSSALAKGAIAGQVCGADGCQDVTRDRLGGMLANGDPTGPPAAAAPFVEIRLRVISGPNGETDRVAFDYLPGLGLARPHDGGGGGGAGWIKLYPDSRGSLDEAVGATEPRPASELARLAGLPSPDGDGDGLRRWAIAGAALALLALAARYATSALKARPRASKSAN